MISRIRIEAFGPSAADVEHALFVAYTRKHVERQPVPGTNFSYTITNSAVPAT